MAATTPTAFLAGLPAAQRGDAKRVHALVRKTAPDLRPFVAMGMLAYGKFHYRYASRREGDTALMALAPRAHGFSFYVNAVKDGKYLAESYGKRLGKVSCGKSCIRFRKADDLDADALTALIREARAVGGSGQT